MIEDNTVRETVARVTGRADPNAEAAAIAAHAKDPLKNPAPASSGDESAAPAPEAGDDTGGRESAEEQPTNGDPEQPRETTGTSAGSEVATLVVEAAGLPADMADLLSGDVAQMRAQAERLARYRDERTASAPAPLTRRPTPALRPGTGEAPAIDPAEVARQAREG